MRIYLKRLGNNRGQIILMEIHQVEICQDGKIITQPKKKSRKEEKKRRKEETRSMNTCRIKGKKREEKENKIQIVPL